MLFFSRQLADFDAGAREGLAGEVLLLGFDKGDFAVFGGVDSEVAASIGAFAGDFGATGLADEYFACFDFLATEALDAKALTRVVVDVFACSACFDVGHYLLLKTNISRATTWSGR